MGVCPGGEIGEEPLGSTLLASYYREFLSSDDLARFEAQVLARFDEAALGQILKTSRDEQTRRAATLGLAVIGTFRSNDLLAGALAEEDDIVRGLAEAALWDIWCRAGTPDQNARLKRIQESIRIGEEEKAIELCAELIREAPRFAEAYNQRAIARFLQGSFEESASDCRRVLELNPKHFGALSGLGRCCLRLGLNQEALDAYQRASRLQPYNESLQQIIGIIEQTPND